MKYQSKVRDVEMWPVPAAPVEDHESLPQWLRNALRSRDVFLRTWQDMPGLFQYVVCNEDGSIGVPAGGCIVREADGGLFGCSLRWFNDNYVATE